jgi:hypothetical protein
MDMLMHERTPLQLQVELVGKDQFLITELWEVQLAG